MKDPNNLKEHMDFIHEQCVAKRTRRVMNATSSSANKMKAMISAMLGILFFWCASKIFISPK